MATRVKKTTYNWETLRLQFFQSHHTKVTPFLVEQGLLQAGQEIGGYTGGKVKGWAEEKHEWLRTIVQEQLDNLGKDDMAVVTTMLVQAKVIVIQGIMDRLRVRKQVEVTDRLGNKRLEWHLAADMRELRDMWAILRTELGEPLVITQSHLPESPILDEIPLEEMERMIRDANDEARATANVIPN